MKFRFRVLGTPIKTIQTKLKNLEPNLKKEINTIGINAVNFMKTYIGGHKKRSQSGEPTRLENSIGIEFHRFGWGIGNIEKMNQQAPHWHWINFGVAQSGRKIPPSTLEFPGLKGHFEPSQNGRFKKGSPKFPIYPKKAISAMNYIDNTRAYINSQISRLFK